MADTIAATALAQILTDAALHNVRETGADVLGDIRALDSGRHTPESLLAHCLDGADDDRGDGWAEYVDALVGLDDQWLAWRFASDDPEADPSMELIAVYPTREAAERSARRAGADQIQHGIAGEVVQVAS